MDSIVGGEGLAEGAALYEADLTRLRTYTDMKKASLYSVLIEGTFARPLAAIPCEVYDSFRRLAEGRRHAFESMYLAPVRAAGGLGAFLENLDSPRMNAVMAAVTGNVGRAAFEACTETGDESKIRDLFDRLLGFADPKAGGEDNSRPVGSAGTGGAGRCRDSDVTRPHALR